MKVIFEVDTVEEAYALASALRPGVVPVVVGEPLQSLTPTPTTVSKPARANVSPGEPPITKMGKDMKVSMLAAVGSFAFGPNYNGKSLKYLQLMCKRGELRYDGKEYYKP